MTLGWVDDVFTEDVSHAEKHWATYKNMHTHAHTRTHIIDPYSYTTIEQTAAICDKGVIRIYIVYEYVHVSACMLVYMCVCVCVVFVYVCWSLGLYVDMCLPFCVSVSSCVSLCVSLDAYAYVCVHESVCQFLCARLRVVGMSLFACTFVCNCVCLYACMCLRIYVCVCVYVCL